MSDLEFSRRALLRNAVYVGGGMLVLGACTGGSSGDTSSSGSESELPDIEGGEVITDPSQFPTSFQESPEFARQVAAGDLPEVAQRIGQDPLVIRPVHEIGTYSEGGTIRRGFIGVEDFQNANLFCAGPDNLLYWDYRHENVVPNIARDFEWNSDFTELTLHLRRGMSWSDGEAFTADDIIFWRDAINLNPAVSAGSSALRVDGKNVEIEKVDDFTVFYRCPVPYAALPEFLAGLNDVGGLSYGGPFGGGGFAPEHYLSQFHPEYSSEQEVNAAATDAGFESWSAYLLNQSSWHLNPDLPMVTPWVCTRPINNPPFEFAANPFSVWVDTDGNQLPYIPTIRMTDAGDTQVMTGRAIAGEYDFQDRGLEVKSMPVLIKNEAESDYTIHQAPSEAIDCAVVLNLAYEKDQEIGDLIRTVEFRRALSLGVDRHEVNQTFFLDSGTETASVPSDTSDYFPGGEWRTKWATQDVEQANQLLDDMGLTDRDDDGFRMLPSGGDRIRMVIESAVSKLDFPAIGESVRRQWSQIGIDATNDPIDGLLLVDRVAANDMMVSLNVVYGTEDPFVAPFGILPVISGSASNLIGPPFVQWYLSNGQEGSVPPESLSLMRDAVELYRDGIKAPSDERAEIGKEIFRMHADQVWSIGVVGFGLSTYGLYYAKNDLGNVPARTVNSSQLKNPTIAMPTTFYYR